MRALGSGQAAVFCLFSMSICPAHPHFQVSGTKGQVLGDAKGSSFTQRQKDLAFLLANRTQYP